MAEIGGINSVLHLTMDETDLANIKKQLNEISISKESQEGVEALNNGLSTLSDTAENANVSIEAIVKSMNDVDDSFDNLQDALNELYDDNKKAAEETTQSWEDLEKEIDQANNKTDIFDNTLKKVAAGVAAYFAVDKIKDFVGNVIEVRSQFASIESSFKTLLGSEEKASKMFQEIKEFGATTPMDLKGLASAGQMMLGFGIESEKVLPYLKALGDASQGDAQRFQSLALAFSQASASGKLMGGDLMQMINAGFNPLEQMAITTGKSIAELKEEMSKGAISAEMMQQAFVDATSEGGKYYGMLEAQSKTLKGALSNLGDTFDSMYNEIGEGIEGVALDVIKTIEYIVQNYKEVGKIVLELAVAYGTYRAVLMVTTAWEKASAKAIAINNLAKAKGITLTEQATAKTILFKNAQMSLNTALNSLKSMVNPYSLIVAAIVGIGYAIYKVATYQNEAEKSIKRMNESTKDFTQSLSKEKSECEYLFGKLKALDKGSKEYQQTKATIQNKYHEYLATLDDEKQKLEDVEGAYKAITAAMTEKWKYQALDKVKNEYYAGMGNLEVGGRDFFEGQSKNFTSERKGRIKALTDQMLSEIKDSQITYDEALKKYANVFKEFEVEINANDPSNPFGKNKITYNAQAQKDYVKDYIRQRDALNAEMKRQEERYANTWNPDLGKEEQEKKDKQEQADKDALARALKNYKERIEAEKKYSEELVRIENDRNAQLRALAENVDISDERKKILKENINQAASEQINELDAKSILLTDDVKKAIKKQYEDRAEYEGLQIEDLKKKRLEKLAELETMNEKYKKSETLASAKTAYNDIASVTAEIGKLDDMIAKLDFDYSDKTQQYLNFVNAYGEITKNFSNDTTNLLKDLSKAKNNLANLNKGKQKATEDYNLNKSNNNAKELQKYDKQIQDQQIEIERLESVLSQRYEEAQGQIDLLKQQYGNILFEDENGESLTIEELFTQQLEQASNQTLQVLQQNLNALKLEIQSQKDLQKTGKDTSKIISQLQLKIIATEKAISDLKQKKDAEELVEPGTEKNPWEKAREKWGQYQNAIKGCTNEMRNLGEVAGGTFGETIKNLANVFDTTMSLGDSIMEFGDTCQKLIIATTSGTVSALQTIEAASGILKIISLVFQLIDAMKKLFTQTDEVKRFKADMEDVRKELRQTREEIDRDLMRNENNSIFGEDVFGAFTANARIAKDALMDYQNLQNEIIQNAATKGDRNKGNNATGIWNAAAVLTGADGAMTGIGGLLNFGSKGTIDQIKGQFDTIEETIGNMWIKLQHKTWFRKEEGSTLKDAIPELFGTDGKVDMEMLTEFVNGGSEAYEKLSKENKDYLQDLVKNYQDYQAAMDEMKNQMSDWFGSIGNEIVDIWVDAFKAGEDGMEDMETAWKKSMENMAKSMIFNQTMSKTFKEIEKQIEDSGYYEDPQRNQGVILDIMDSGFAKLKKDQEVANEMMSMLQEKYGLFEGEESDATRNGLSKGVNSLTQDTAEEMNGRLTQIQSHTFSINEQCLQMREFASQQLVILQGIKTDTARLETIETSIISLNSKVGDIQTFGLKMK